MLAPAMRAARWQPPRLGHDQTLSQREDRQIRAAPLQEHRQEQLRDGQSGAFGFFRAAKSNEQLMKTDFGAQVRYSYETLHTPRARVHAPRGGDTGDTDTSNG